MSLSAALVEVELGPSKIGADARGMEGLSEPTNQSKRNLVSGPSHRHLLANFGCSTKQGTRGKSETSRSLFRCRKIDRERKKERKKEMNEPLCGGCVFLRRDFESAATCRCHHQLPTTNHRPLTNYFAHATFTFTNHPSESSIPILRKKPETKQTNRPAEKNAKTNAEGRRRRMAERRRAAQPPAGAALRHALPRGRVLVVDDVVVVLVVDGGVPRRRSAPAAVADGVAAPPQPPLLPGRRPHEAAQDDRCCTFASFFLPYSLSSV